VQVDGQDGLDTQCRQWACELGLQGIRVVWLRTTGLPATIPDTGDAVADLGTGFGAGMTRAEIIARMPTLAELGNAAAFLAPDRAGVMTATLANITCGPSPTSSR
jgi:3-oxoacyl-[acyl-carrier protein] reductase